MKQGKWKKYVDVKGDFEFPKYLYKSLTELMKTNLDLGTLVCQDPVKLRAYKEQVKRANTQLWFDIAEAFEYFDVVQPCICSNTQYCEICGGSRYVLSETMNADKMKQISLVTTGSEGNTELAEKLRLGMEQAQIDVEKWNRSQMTFQEAREVLGYGQAEE